MSSQTNLKKALSKGDFVITCDCPPVVGTDLSPVSEFAAAVKDRAVAVRATDNANATVGTSALILAKALLDAGAEPILEMATRDRNRMALQSDLLGAGALGIGNIQSVTGVHPAGGDHPQCHRVYDLDATQWLAAAAKISQEQTLISGQKATGGADFFLGAAANPFVRAPEMHLLVLKKKIQAGAGYVITSPVTDLDKFKAWLGLIKEAGLEGKIAVLAGVDAADPASAKETIQAIQAIKGVAGAHLTALEATDAAQVLN